MSLERAKHGLTIKVDDSGETENDSRKLSENSKEHPEASTGVFDCCAAECKRVFLAYKLFSWSPKYFSEVRSWP